ncbi:hypothetical protein SAMN05216480_101373 [Pustulibacterium marinum]|uniref:Uncharacterized protein n=1 Tax=Pustulibacterium marinum TaxID=1224947 RepID=A0A1I7EX75_9FLAO|nr:hypothetical protein [Pustulibacterium marinum]SFU28511.1 hypothetical protein SAMN05216480_101373 [Pustulibacterium marinum]
MRHHPVKIGIISFFIVLFFMPIGHALMVLTDVLLQEQKLSGAFFIGFLGCLLLFISINRELKSATATLLGLLAGVLVWTGWIEFSFVWIAEKLSTPALVQNGVVVTKPEYLLMPSSLGLLGAFSLFYLFTSSKCQFFNWFQKRLHIKKHIKQKEKGKPVAVITFIETIMILWVFYMVLLFVYDDGIFGDQHPVTYLVAFGSLVWSGYLLPKLLRIQKFDYAIRYAIPTVIIFWNFVEILGRWNLFKEVWIHPLEYWKELLGIAIVLLGFVAYYLRKTQFTKRDKLLI